MRETIIQREIKGYRALFNIKYINNIKCIYTYKDILIDSYRDI